MATCSLSEQERLDREAEMLQEFLETGVIPVSKVTRTPSTGLTDAEKKAKEVERIKALPQFNRYAKKSNSDGYADAEPVYLESYKTLGNGEVEVEFYSPKDLKYNKAVIDKNGQGVGDVKSKFGTGSLFNAGMTLLGEDSKKEVLVKGDEIKLFSQIKIQNGVLKGKHVTFDFSPQSNENIDGPDSIAKDGTSVKVKLIGEYKDADMHYYTVEVEADGKTYRTQKDGTPLHVTVMTNAENGIKPFMTGKHAKGNPNAANKKSKPSVLSGVTGTVKGIFNPDFGKKETASVKVLGAQEGVKLDAGTFKVKEGDYVNDLEAVKTLANELKEASTIGISEEHVQTLEGVLDMFVGKGKKFIPDMKVYLDTEANKSIGALVVQGNDKLPRGIYIGIDGKPQVAGNEKNAMETYVHELIHGATEFALEYNKADSADVRLRLEKLYTEIMPEITYKDLMPVGSEYDSKKEKKVAEAMLRHMRGKDGIKEFITHGLTNERMVAKLKSMTAKRERDKAKSVWEVIKNMVSDLIDAAFNIKRRENRDQDALTLLTKLSLQLAEVNNQAIHTRDSMNVINKFGEGVERVNEYISDMQASYEKKLSEKDIVQLKGTEGKLGKLAWLSKSVWRMMNDSTIRPFYENALSEIGVRPEGFTQSIIRGFSEDDALQQTVEQLGLQSGKIDGMREEVAANIGNIVVNMFDKKLSKQEQETITAVVLDTDLSYIYDMYSTEQLKAMLTDKTVLAKEIKKAQDAVMDLKAKKEDKYFYVNQAKGLGRYMATHEGSEVQLLNATNIVNKLGTVYKARKESSVDSKAVIAVETLASLSALEHTGQFSKTKLSEMLEADEEAIHNVTALHKDFVAKSMKDMFGDGKSVNAIKGYTRELFDEDTNLQIAPISAKKELTDQGYKFVYSLSAGKGDTTGVEMGVFLSKDRVVQNFNRAAMRMTDTSRRGTTMADSRRYAGKTDLLDSRLAKQDVARVVRHNKKIVEQQRKGITTVPVTGRVPVLNEGGTVINYRYMMNKETKKDLLGQDTRAPRVLGRMYAAILDKQESSKINHSIMDVMFKDAEDMYKNDTKYGKNSKEYVVIKADSLDPQARELWNILPKYAKDRISKLAQNKPKGSEKVKDTEYEGGIPVRRDLMFAYFGARDLSAADAPGISLSPAAVKHVIRMAEMIWKEIVAIAKADIVIRTPKVLWGNIVSNLVLSMQMGMNPVAIAKLQIQGFRELKEYKRKHHELLKLKAEAAVEKKRGNYNAAKGHKIVALEQSLKQNSVRELIDAGLFQSIIEDVNVDDLKASSKMSRAIDKKMENMPQFVKDGANYLYLTERTSVFKMMTTATQYSDFIARYALYQTNVKKANVKLERKEKRYATDEEKTAINKRVLKQVTDAFINYNTPDSKILQYMNDMGLVMFTKFFLRIQKVVKKGIVQNPLNFLFIFFAEEVMLMDVDDVTDHTLYAKGLTSSFHNPLETLEHFYTPTALEAVGLIK